MNSSGKPLMSPPRVTIFLTYVITKDEVEKDIINLLFSCNCVCPNHRIAPTTPISISADYFQRLITTTPPPQQVYKNVIHVTSLSRDVSQLNNSITTKQLLGALH